MSTNLRSRRAPGADQVLARLRLRVPGPLRDARPDTPLGELPLDSLDFVELLCAIEEEFGVRLSEAEFQGARNVGDLAAMVAGHTS